MKFEDYKIAKVIKTEIHNLGWVRPTDIQFKAIQPILNGEDVLAIAQTGTGKTASFVIPILNQIHNQLEKKRSIMFVPWLWCQHESWLNKLNKFLLKLGKELMSVHAP